MTRILHLSDPHVVAPPKKFNGVIDTAKAWENYIDFLIPKLPRFDHVDFVFVSGDLTQFGDLESCKLFKFHLERLDVPYGVIPGNHDLREPIRDVFTFPPLPAGSKKINWKQEFDDFDLIALDTLVEGSAHGELCEETLDFLKSNLSVQHKPILLGLHHPPFKTGVKFMDEINLKNAEQFENLLQDTKFEVRVICGHLHNFHIATFGQKTTISAPSTFSTFELDTRDSAPIGFYEIEGGALLHAWDNGFVTSHISSQASANIMQFN